MIQLDKTYAGAFYVRGCAFEKLDMIDENLFQERGGKAKIAFQENKSGEIRVGYFFLSRKKIGNSKMAFPK